MCNAKALFASSAILSLISAVFFLIGAASHGDDRSTVENIPFGVGDFESSGGITFGISGDVFLGLQGFVTEFDNGDDTEYDTYADCDFDFCDTCEDVGATVDALCVISLVLAIVVVVFGAMGAMSDGSMIAKIGCTVGSVVSAILSIVAFVTFRPCFADYVDDAAEVFGSSSATYGIAGWLTLIGFALMALAALLSTITFCISGGDVNYDKATTGVGM